MRYRGVVRPNSMNTMAPAKVARAPQNQNSRDTPTLCVPFRRVVGVLKIPLPRESQRLTSLGSFAMEESTHHPVDDDAYY